MSDRLDMPVIQASELETSSGLALVTDNIGAILRSDIPALMIRETSRDTTPILKSALETLGVEIVEIVDGGPHTMHYWRPARIQLTSGSKRHIDGRYFSYPSDLDYVSLRRHTAVVEGARVRARHTKPSQGPGYLRFKPDRHKPDYEAVQQPMDQILFIEYGGILNDAMCLPAQHLFTPLARFGPSRLIRNTDFHLMNRANRPSNE